MDTNSVPMEVSTDKDALLHGRKASNDNKIKLLYAIIIICGCIIISLSMLNLWQAGYFDSDENNTDSVITTECNGNGHKYSDINICECYQCYGGEKCEEAIINCTISAGSGQPFLFVEFWVEKATNGEISSINLPIDYRVPYQFDELTTIGPFNQYENTTFPQKVNQLIRRIHKKYHNVDIDGKYIVFGVGVSQLTTAAYTAWSRIRGAPIIAFEEIPHYFGHPMQCTAATPYHCSWSTSYDLYPRNDSIREILIFPHNPTGFERERVYPNQSSGGLDLVYYWPHFYDTNDDLEPKQAPVAFFSLTKLGGHAATRFGWAVIESEELANEMRMYVVRSVLGISIESIRRAWDILNYIEGQNGDEFFEFVRKRMKERWEIFNNIFEGQNNFVQHARIGTQYGWVQCVGRNETEIRALFESYSITPMYGSSFGSPGFVRFNLAEFEGNFVRIMNRFKQLVDDQR
eukprot:37312_1